MVALNLWRAFYHDTEEGVLFEVSIHGFDCRCFKLGQQWRRSRRVEATAESRSHLRLEWNDAPVVVEARADARKISSIDLDALFLSLWKIEMV